MKNKILLGSVTLLSALMVAACGNGEKKATETTAAPTTQANTTATVTTTTTAGASSNVKEISLADIFLKTGPRIAKLKYNMFHQINIMLWHYTISLKIK